MVKKFVQKSGQCLNCAHFVCVVNCVLVAKCALFEHTVPPFAQKLRLWNVNTDVDLLSIADFLTSCPLPPITSVPVANLERVQIERKETGMSCTCTFF